MAHCRRAQKEPGSPKGCRLLRDVLFLFFILIVAGQASPVYAQVECCGETAWYRQWMLTMKSAWAEDLKQAAQLVTALKDWVGGLTGFNNQFSDFTDQYDKKEGEKVAAKDVLGALRSKLDSTQSEQEQAQEIAVANAENVSERDEQEEDPNVTAIISNLVLVRQAQAEMFPYAQAVEDTITQSNMSWNRGSSLTDTMNYGPFYTLLSQNMDCPAPGTPYANNLKGGNAALDLAPDRCVEKFTDGTINTEAADINFIATMMVSPGDPGPLFVFPALKTIEEKGAGGAIIKTRLPVPDDNLLKLEDADGKAAETFTGQQLWMAAVKFCFYAMGPRPARPASTTMMTPTGLSIGAQWDQCAVVQAAFARQCADLIAYHTIPYCGDNLRGGVYDKLCADTLIACEAASALGASLPFGCNHPLSMYRAELASQLACFPTERYLYEKEGEGEDEAVGVGETVLESEWCTRNYAQWKKKVELQNSNFLLALKAFLKMKDCWPEWSPEHSIGTAEQVAAEKAQKEAAAQARAEAAEKAELEALAEEEKARTGDPRSITEMVEDFWKQWKETIGTARTIPAPTTPSTSTSSTYASAADWLAAHGIVPFTTGYYGNGQCVAFVRGVYTSLPPASTWEKGDPVTSALAPGTPIATFNFDGKYGPPNSPGGIAGGSHTAIYLGQDPENPNNIIVAHQWVTGSGSGGVITSSVPASKYFTIKS